MAEKKAPAKKKDPVKAEFERAQKQIKETPDTLEFRAARKYLIMYVRELQSILTARK